MAACLLVGVVLVACTNRSGKPRSWWKFWAPRDEVVSEPFSLEIPTPPELTMPPMARPVLEPPKSSAGADGEGDQRRAPATLIQPELRTVYFDYDSADLTDETKESLRQNAQWLRAHLEIEVQVQGHCDERGTVEYNFNLGQRRANAVKMFLVDLGVSPSRIHTISYGEERPAVAGSTEEAWRLNRRAEFHAY